MTFTLIDTDIRETLDVETLDDLFTLYDDFGNARLVIDFAAMTITVERE